MSDKERRAERAEQEDLAGMHRGIRRQDTDEESSKAKTFTVKKLPSGNYWVVHNTATGKDVFKASSEEAAYKKRDELIGRDTSFLGKVKKFFKGDS